MVCGFYFNYHFNCFCLLEIRVFRVAEFYTCTFLLCLQSCLFFFYILVCSRFFNNYSPGFLTNEFWKYSLFISGSTIQVDFFRGAFLANAHFQKVRLRQAKIDRLRTALDLLLEKSRLTFGYFPKVTDLLFQQP